MYEFLCQLDSILQHLTSWLSCVTVAITIAIAACEIAHFIVSKKHDRK